MNQPPERPERSEPDLGRIADALRVDLAELVAAGEISEFEASQILPGYEYPELLLWVRPPLHELHPKPVDNVRERGLRLQQAQAWQRFAVERDAYTAERDRIAAEREAHGLDTDDDSAGS